MSSVEREANKRKKADKVSSNKSSSKGKNQPPVKRRTLVDSELELLKSFGARVKQEVHEHISIHFPQGIPFFVVVII
jgi:hypothetical protein